MLVTLSGVTGAGKSFFKNLIAEELDFKNLPIVTTRQKREGEINGIDKEFVTEDEFEKMKTLGVTQVNFEFLGSKYGYRKEHLQAEKNQVTEVHYTTIYELKKQVRDLFAIYIIPSDINRAKAELQKRNLPREDAKKRLEEIDIHIKEYSNNQTLQKQFDWVLINDYTENSNKKLIDAIQKKIKEIK